MPNLKAIRDQIQSVKNTKKITEAMRLVAAAKVRLSHLLGYRVSGTPLPEKQTHPKTPTPHKHY